MSALAVLVFVSAAGLAVSSMAATVRRYGGVMKDVASRALALDAQSARKPPGRRSIASRGHVGTPRQALARGRRVLGFKWRGSRAWPASRQGCAVVCS